MTQPYKTTQSTAEVRVSGLSTDTPPAITVIYDTIGRGGAARRIVRQISIPDAEMFHRLETEVTQGDKIMVSVKTDWYDTGSVTCLTAFQKLFDAKQNLVVTNGAERMIQNGLSTATVSPVKTLTEKARK